MQLRDLYVHHNDDFDGATEAQDYYYPFTGASDNDADERYRSGFGNLIIDDQPIDDFNGYIDYPTINDHYETYCHTTDDDCSAGNHQYICPNDGTGDYYITISIDGDQFPNCLSGPIINVNAGSSYAGDYQTTYSDDEYCPTRNYSRHHSFPNYCTERDHRSIADYYDEPHDNHVVSPRRDY